MRTRVLSHLRLALYSVVVGVALVEVVLRLVGYTYSPLALIPADNRNDFRPEHMAGHGPRAADEPLTVFDPELLWAPNPRFGNVFARDGTRGGPLADARTEARKLIVAVGDSNTLGPRDAPDHWPGYLQDLLAMNAPQDGWRVVNAGVYGYSSFQGLRRARDALRHRPDLVYWSFGANDAHPVRQTDEDYSRRVARLAGWRWLRIAPPLLHAWWHLRDDTAGPVTHRVPLADYRRNLEEFVRLCREAGARPVLLTRPYRGRSDAPDHWMSYAPAYNEATRDVAAAQGVDLVDAYEAFRAAPHLFADESHFTRRGYQRMSQELLGHLHARELVATAFLYHAAVYPGASASALPELGDGWYAAEDWPDGPRGRWTAQEAQAVLERRGHEAGLEVDLELFRTTNRTTGRIEAGGRTLLRIDHPNGRLLRTLDVSSIADARIEVRLIVDETVRGSHRDPRQLGLFVHSLVLRPTALAPFVRAGDLGDDRPELATGFWWAETWADGRRGRWTKQDAVLRLGRIGGENRLVVEFSLESPLGETAGWFEVNGRRLASFRGPNERRVETIDIGGVTGDEIALRVRVDTPFVPRALDAHTRDARTLGVFVHEARLERAGPEAR
jgi:lysophospholipase L1-like esterase